MSQVKAIRDNEIPVWEKDELPEKAHVIMIAKQYVARYGCEVDAWYRLPISRLKGSALNSPLATTIRGGGLNIAISPTKVVPAYISQTEPNEVRRATPSNPSTFAKFLIVAKDNADYIVQSNGVYHFPEGHGYLVGRTYYLGEDGTPSTLKPAQPEKVQKLFYVLNSNTIDIQVG